ncbi:benzyl alcohol O-benzoyltransferase [Handroanthus impetiginosus]|uniref:Benzyl alcohol O-benzoyltransferase n=1 Tax=Handroanthus impetiginosus TaxID=429701 RepID=A0A2G9HQ01_9LAMI|nr:benzyl alcohol O-benzoyltransferase [Handroanthus impetiginosus]
MALSKTIVFNVNRREPQLVAAEKPTPNEIKQLSDIDDQEGLRFLVPFIFFYPPIVGGELDLVKIIRDAWGWDLPPCPYIEELMCRVPDSGGIIGCPLLFLQITRFICGGLSMGILLNHTLADGYGAMLFLNTKTELFKGASVPSVQTVWQRELLSARSPPRITCTHNEYEQVASNNQNPKDNFIQASIFFGPKEIQALKDQLPTNQIPSPTRFELTTACLWKCRTIALEPNPNDITRISIVMNARRKKEIGLAIGYYGNGVSPLTYALDLVRQAEAQLSEEYIKSVADFMVIKGRPKYEKKLNYMVSDLTNLHFDKFDLGWGKPLYAGVPRTTSIISFYTSLNFKE